MKPTEPSSPPSAEVQRQHAEQEFAGELAALAAADDRARPPNWKLSPWAVRTYLLGGKLADGFQITPKYIGNARLIEIAVATLATDRALLLLGRPGDREVLGRGAPGGRDLGRLHAAGPGHRRDRRDALRYGWNYARLLVEGPSQPALVVKPDDEGDGGRQDRARRGADPHPQRGAGHADHASSRRRRCPIPELDIEVQARKGFNVIATANNRDKGVNESVERAPAPLQHRRPARARLARRRGRDRRSQRVGELGRALELPAEKPAARRDSPRGHDLPRAAQRRHRGRQDQAQVAQRHAVDRRGDLGRDQRPRHRRPTTATA